MTEAAMNLIQKSLVKDNLWKSIDAAKDSSRNDQVAFLKESGIDVPNHVSDSNVMLLVMSFTQVAWFTLNEQVTEERLMRHRHILEEFQRVAAELPPAAGDEKKLPNLPKEKMSPELVESEGKQGIFIGGVFIPVYLVKGGLRLTIDGLPQDPKLLQSIIEAAGYPAFEEAKSEILWDVAAGVVHGWWFKFALKSGVIDAEGATITVSAPENAEHDQQLRYQRYLRLLSGKKRGTKAVKEPKAPKEPKPAKEPKAPKAPKAPKEPKAAKEKSTALPPAVKRLKELKFKVMKESPELKGQTGKVYEAVVATMTPEGALLDKIVEHAVAQGFSTGEPAGPAPRVRWLALEMVKKGILELSLV